MLLRLLRLRTHTIVIKNKSLILYRFFSARKAEHTRIIAHAIAKKTSWNAHIGSLPPVDSMTLWIKFGEGPSPASRPFDAESCYLAVWAWSEPGSVSELYINIIN